MTVRSVPYDRLSALGLQYGVEVIDIAPGGTGARSGLKQGDIIFGFDDQPVYSPRRLQWLAQQARARGKASIDYQRDGQSARAEILLARPPGPETAAPQQPEWASRAYLGIQMQPLTEDLRTVFGASAEVGVLVSEVEKGSPAAESGLAAGDVIVRMDRKTIRSPDHVRRVVHYFDPGETLEVEVIRNKQTQVFQVTLGELSPPAAARSPTDGWQRFFDEHMPSAEEWLRNLDELMDQWKDSWRDYQNPPAEPGSGRVL